MTVLADDTPAPSTPDKKPAAALSVDEMKTRSTEFLALNDSSYRELLHLKEVAKKQKDVIKLSCINDKLVQIKAQISITEDANTELQTALSSSSDTRFALFQKTSEDSAGVARMRDEGRACIGTPELYKQEAGLDVTKPEIPDDPGTIDPYNPEGLPGYEIDPPGYASPFN